MCNTITYSQCLKSVASNFLCTGDGVSWSKCTEPSHWEFSETLNKEARVVLLEVAAATSSYDFCDINLVGLPPLVLFGERFPLLQLEISRQCKRWGGVLVLTPSQLDEWVEIQKDKVLEFNSVVTGIHTNNLHFFPQHKSWFLKAACIPQMDFFAQAAVPCILDQEAGVGMALV